jgi:RHS repeat-associated protein
MANLGVTASNQTRNVIPSSSRNIDTVLEKASAWVESLRVVTITEGGSWQPDENPGKTSTPGFGSAPTQEPTFTPTITNTVTPEPTITATLTPTDVLTTTTTPTPEPGVTLSNLEVTLDPDPAAPGDVITATWSIKNYRGKFEGVEIWAYLPEEFIPMEIGEGSFDPQSNLLIMPINGPDGLLSWYIDGNAQPPYNILVEIHRNGQVIMNLNRQLGQRGPDVIPIEGGRANGFNRHVKIDFPAGALPESADVLVRAPHNSNISLGGHPMELTAIGRASGMEISQFNQPITITVQYTDEEAERQLKNAGMKDENSLTLFYYDEAQGTWYPIPTRVDADTNTLTAITTHFSLDDFKAQNWEAARLPTMDGFQVAGFTGAATYSYPIQVPPGPGGLQPSLELSYNSQEVDAASSRTQASWVGMGWSLDTGYIQRNMNGTPNYLGDDTFTLVMKGAGGLLLPITDQDSDSNTIDYRLASDNLWRIRQYLATGDVWGYPGDKSTWVIFTPDGTQYYFGASDGMGGHAWYNAYPSTCASITMTTWKWGLSRVRNIFGKELYYSYNAEYSPSPKYIGDCDGYRATINEALYPDSISYGNSRYRVIFVREGGTGIGNRTDYDPYWDHAFATVFYMRAKLLRIEIWNDPNGQWGSGDETLIRKYVFGYGENGQQIFPGVSWPVYQGKTPTLTSITEYGLNGTSSLPKTEFFYDSMHLDYAKNGYGGKVDFGYDIYHANDGFEKYQGYAAGNLSGEFYPDTSSPYGDDLNWLKTYYQPGNYYKIEAKVWTSFGYSWAKLGIDDGITHVYGDQISLTPATWNIITSYIIISQGATQARALLYCKDTCKLNDYKVYPLVSRYRSINKTLIDEVTNSFYTTNYQYEGGAVNDTGTSDFVLNYSDGYRLMTKPNTEFRGHSHVIETDPDGKVVETWYKQDDIFKGMAYQTKVKDSNGNLYTQTNTNYNYEDHSWLSAPVLPHPKNQPVDFYKDLKLIWTYTTSEENRIYNGGITYIATKNDYQYILNDQGGAQYGNRTRTISSSWNGFNWLTYRGSITTFYPTITNGTPESSRYLTGLPAYKNNYACPGSCDWEIGDLTSGFKWLYDGHSNYTTPPTDGVLTGTRNLIFYLIPPRTDPRYADTQYTYDAWGNRTSTTQYTGATDINSFGMGTGAQISYTCYGGGGSLGGHTCDDNYGTYLLWEHDALGHITNYTYDYTKSMPLSISDPNDFSTNDTTVNATYDDFGRITSIIRPGDTGNYQTIKMSYHNALVPYNLNPFQTEAKQRIGGTTYFTIRKYYNGIGQLLQTQTVGATIGSQTKDLLADTFYDAGGRVSKQTVPYEVATGFYFHQQNGDAAATQSTYDVLGRILTNRATDGSMTYYYYSHIYSDNIPYLSTTVTNPRNYDITTLSDVWGRVVQIIPSTSPSVSYTYDEADRLTDIMRGGLPTTIRYDFGGRKISMVDPDMGEWSYTYDALGNIITQVDARSGGGCTTTLSYDSLNRLTGKTYSGNCGVATASVSYAYDSGTNGIGRRTGMNDGSGSTSWVYDTRGRMTQETKVITGSGTFKTMWAYNSADLVTSLTYPASNNGTSGEVVNFTYVNQMLLDTAIGTNTYVNNTDYNASGQVDLRDLGLSGSNPVISVDYTYYLWTDINGQGRLKKIADSLQDLRYTYDANGNVLTIEDNKAGNPQIQTFTYDGIDRLTSAVATGGTGGTYTLQNYTYNNTTGNLSSNAGVNYTYGDGNHDHAVTQMGSNTFAYDANGNQTTRNVGGSSFTLSYEAENRLVGVSGAATASFVYDGDGNRVKGTIGGTTTTYIGNYFEWTGSTSTMKKYYYAGSTRVAMRTGSGTLNYLLGDHLGSQAITTNSSGGSTGEIRYYPWGTERYNSGTTPTTYHFTGQRLESALGLYFYGERWYDPYLNRWIQPDTIIPDPNNSQSYDRYAYSYGNPVKYIDPSGHKACEGWDAMGGCITEGEMGKPKTTIPLPSTPPDSLLNPGYEWELVTQGGITTSYNTPSAPDLFNGSNYDPNPNNWAGDQYNKARMEGNVVIDGKLWMYDNSSRTFKPGEFCGGYPTVNLGCLHPPSTIQVVDGYYIQNVNGAVAACPPNGGGTEYCGQQGFDPAYQQGGPYLYVTFNKPPNENFVLIVNPIDSGGKLWATQIDIYGGYDYWYGPWVSNAIVWIQIPVQ